MKHNYLFSSIHLGSRGDILAYAVDGIANKNDTSLLLAVEHLAEMGRSKVPKVSAESCRQRFIAPASPPVLQKFWGVLNNFHRSLGVLDDNDLREHVLNGDPRYVETSPSF